MNMAAPPTRPGGMETYLQRATSDLASSAGAGAGGANTGTLGELLARALHDLRSPLAVVEGHAELLRRRLVAAGPATERDLNSLRSITAAARRIGAILDELAEPFGPLGRGPARSAECLRSEPVDLVDVVRRIALESEPRAGVAGRIEVAATEPTLPGHWDRTRLERAVANLVDNALKYSPATNSIVLETGRELGWAVLRVRDRGIGIPADEVGRVCEPHYRASNARQRFTGSGLGLNGVRAFVEVHGGSIEVESAVGVGTTVTLRLPLRAALGANDGRSEPGR